MSTQTLSSPVGRSGRNRVHPLHPPVAERERAERLAFEHGRTYDSYLACEPDRQLFFSSDGSGAISYCVVLGHVKVGGGLLAAPEDRPRLLKEFLRMVTEKYHSAAFFNITDADVPLFRKFRMQITKWGEDALLDLSTWTPAGGAFEWLRRQKNFCQRAGLVTQEWHPESTSLAENRRIEAELRVVERESLQDKPQATTMRFFEGQLDFANLDRKRIFVTRSESGAGRIEAFVVANPYEGGRGWGFEMYRHRLDSVRGAVPFTMLQAIEVLRQDDVGEVSLCLIPGHNCDRQDRHASPLIGKLISFSKTWLQCFFDAAGLAQFKTRFRPRLENRYICTFRRANLFTVATSVHLFGVLYVSPARLLKQWWRSRSRANAG